MAETLECSRELIVDKSADQVWEWLSDLRNVMTANQFHMAAEVEPAAARNPQVGMDVPIKHNIMGREFYRIARVMKAEDYELFWGERLPDDATYEDNFPHSEGWKVESLGANQCRIRNHLKGRFRLPLGDIIGRQAWDAAMPVILDNDLQDVAFGVGAIDHKVAVEMPYRAAVLLKLVHAREVNGVPIREFLDIPAQLSQK